MVVTGIHALAIRLGDVTSPYYLHLSDGPRLVLISQPLEEDSFASWQCAMRLALTVKNKLGFVDGTLPEPYDDADESVKYAWYRGNTIVIAWIINAVSKSIQPSVMYSESAKEIWDDLATRFSQKMDREFSN